MHPLRRLLMLSCLCACAGLASAQERTPAADDDPFGAAPPAFPGRKTSPATIQPVPEATPVNTIPDDDPLLQADPSRVSNKPGARTPPPSASQRVRGAVPPSTPRAEADDGKPPPPISVDGGASVNPAVLAETKDNQLGLQDEDRTPYFRILSLAKQLPQDRLREFARQFRDQRRAAIPRYQKKPAGDFPSFVDMFLNPDVYRGRPVTLKGYFRRIVKFDPGPNENKIGEVYEGWLYTDDSQNNPAVVVFQRKPEGLPLGGNLVEEAEVTGYFFKMYGYEAQDTTRKAPMILAGEATWIPARKSRAFQPLDFRIYLFLTLGIVLIGGVFWWRSIEIRKAQRAAIASRLGGRDFDAFPPVESLDETFVETNDS